MFAKYSRSGLALMGLPLYAGPVLAGWSGAPLVMIAALAAVFFLMQLLARKDETRGEIPWSAFLGVLALAQLAVVAVAYALGAGLTWAFGRLTLALWVPLALSGLGACIGALRYRHTPQQAEMWGAIDQAINSLETGAPFDPGTDEAIDFPDMSDPMPETVTQQLLNTLWALPDETPVARLDDLVQQLEQRVDHHGFHTLMGDVGDGNRNVDRAMLRYVASPSVRAALVGSGDLGFAASVLLDNQDDTVLAELAALTRVLLDENAPASALPPPDALREKAKTVPALAALVDPVAEAWRNRSGQCR